ncbi:MAG: hypothetical protein AMXMBFR72_18620 [Betaproteobacteria bacterium]
MNDTQHPPQPAGTEVGSLRDVLAKTTAAALAVSSAEPGRVFEDLAHALARILGVDAALIAEFSDAGRTRMRTLATVLDGRLLRSFEYEVALTPCRHIVGRESRFVASGVRPEFRPGTMFSELGFDSYAGYSLLGADGAQLGIIVALDRKPMTDRPLTEALLKIFAVRAAAEIERGRAEASYRAIFDAAEDAIFIHDWETGAIVDVNDKAAQVYGYTREQMRTLRVADFSSGEPPYTEEDALRWIALARRGQPVRFEWRRRNRDGSLHWDEVCLKPVQIAGRPHVLAFTREITERKAALEALAQREEQYREIFNASADALVLWSPELRIVDVNPAFLRVYGFTREQIVGQSYPEHFPRDYVGARLQLVRRALAGDTCELQTRAHRADGTPFDVELRVIPIRHRGEPHVLAIARDITERRRAEDALRASEARYRLLFETESDAIVLVDAESLRLVDANQAAVEMYGYPREELLTKTALDVSTDPESTAASIRNSTGAISIPLRWHRRRDGSVFPVEIKANRLVLGGRKTVVAAIRDITERRDREEALRRSEARLRATVEAAFDCVVGMDAEGRIVEFNAAAERTFGYARDQVIGQPLADRLIPPAQRAAHVAGMARYAATGEGPYLGRRIETVAMRADGTEFPVELSIAEAHGAQERIFVGYLRDITDRKRAEQALRASEEQYRAIFNASADAMVLRDAELRLVDANAAFLARHGVRREDVIGRAEMAFITPGSAPGVERLLREALAGRSGAVEAQTIAHDGAVLDVEVRAVPMQYRGRPHVLAIGRDITDRKRAEQALRASEEQYRTVFNASADALILWDSQLRRVDVNPAYERIFGWAREEVVGQRFEHRNVPREYADRRLALVRRALAGEMCHAELESVRKNGERFRAEIHVIPIRYRGEPHVLAIVRDITERRRADEERARLEAQLRQAQKMEAIGQLTGGIAHDFNNILASIMGYVVLAEERAQDAGDDKTAGYLEHALDSCRRARDLIQQMLTFSRGRRGEPRPLKLCELVQDAAPLLRSSMPSTIALDFDCDRDAPPVLADEIQAGQVLLNLAINARDAIGTTGTLRIGVRPLHASGLVCTSCRRTVDGRFVELAVADDGCGIEPAVVDRIFEPFFSTKETGKGSGMGLSMVHGIVHEHRGHVVVETAPGRGSVFRVLLPALLGDDVVASAAPAARRPAMARKLRGRVLLVDDEDSVRNVMQERLRTWGLDVEVASDAATARAAFDAAGGAIDALITDQTMPYETGLDLARALRSRRADLPVILYTGYADELTAAQAQAAGVRLLLRKPVEPAELRAALERVLPAD